MFEAGHPRYGGKPQGHSKAATDLCKHFLENEGWSIAFKIARGEEAAAYVRNRLTGKSQKIVAKPDFETQLTALKFIAGYGLGRPAELAYPDDSGRTVTDLLLAALKAPGHDEAGAR